MAWYRVEKEELRYGAYHYLADRELMDALLDEGYDLTKEMPVDSSNAIWKYPEDDSDKIAMRDKSGKTISMPRSTVLGQIEFLQREIESLKIVLGLERLESKKWKDSYMQLSKDNYIPLTEEEIQEGFLNNTEDYQGWIENREGGWKLCRRVDR